MCFSEEFPRSATAASYARRFLTDVASQWLDASALIDFQFALGEALAGCVRSGRGPSIHVTGACEGGEFAVEVGDFDDELGGVAGFIVHSLADRVEYAPGRRRIRIYKSVAVAAAP